MIQKKGIVSNYAQTVTFTYRVLSVTVLYQTKLHNKPKRLFIALKLICNYVFLTEQYPKRHILINNTVIITFVYYLVNYVVLPVALFIVIHILGRELRNVFIKKDLCLRAAKN